MDRDLIGYTCRIEIERQEWQLQEVCRWDGTVKAVDLFDGAGNLIGEFQSREDAECYIRGQILQE